MTRLTLWFSREIVKRVLCTIYRITTTTLPRVGEPSDEWSITFWRRRSQLPMNCLMALICLLTLPSNRPPTSWQRPSCDYFDPLARLRIHYLLQWLSPLNNFLRNTSIPARTATSPRTTKSSKSFSSFHKINSNRNRTNDLCWTASINGSPSSTWSSSDEEIWSRASSISYWAYRYINNCSFPIISKKHVLLFSDFMY